MTPGVDVIKKDIGSRLAIKLKRDAFEKDPNKFWTKLDLVKADKFSMSEDNSVANQCEKVK